MLAHQFITFVRTTLILNVVGLYPLGTAFLSAYILGVGKQGKKRTPTDEKSSLIK